VQVVLLSEYGISSVDTPIHLNRLFRDQGWLSVKDELGRELLDYGASDVFAVADHQVAHIYCRDPQRIGAVRQLLQNQPGMDQVFDAQMLREQVLNHERAGDLVAVAKERCWFSYYYWLDDARAPDFARTVDIHRKPGYDPVELFLDPAIPFVRGRILWRLLQKRLGFRMLMDVIPLDASLVRGSHGRCPENKNEWPVLISSRNDLVNSESVDASEVYELLRRHCSH
jgi:predicted AlkP superfamily pyrophosphatase or phosphodiesterase